jgi:site-specific recombinase XerD
MKPFLFKRGKFYQLQYFNEEEQKVKRISTKCNKKNDAIKFLINFQKTEYNKPKLSYKFLFEFSDEYKDYIKLNFSKKYLMCVASTFKIFQTFTGDMQLNKISSQLVERFISSVKSKHRARTHYINLKSVFNKAKLWNYISENPLQKIKIPKVPVNYPLFITENELDIILANELNENLKANYLFAYHTGMRLGEIINLKWNQISFKERIIRVINTDEFTTKGKRERVIPINCKLYEVLVGLVPKIIDLNDYVFKKNGFKYNIDYLSKNFKKAVKRTKSINPKTHYHTLRHSFASNLVKNGVPITTIKELLGHVDISTSLIYAHVTIDSLKQAVKVLEG